MEKTARLSLPLLAPGQAQKEMVHNEALQRLDCIAAACAQELPRDDPPASPAEGACYIIGGSPTGDWTQHAEHLAVFTGAGWRFVAPIPGLSVREATSGKEATYTPAGWVIGEIHGSRVLIDGNQVIGPRQPAIPGPAGGATTDAEARLVLGAILTALRQHGLIAP